MCTTQCNTGYNNYTIYIYHLQTRFSYLFDVDIKVFITLDIRIIYYIYIAVRLSAAWTESDSTGSQYEVCIQRRVICTSSRPLSEVTYCYYICR